MGRAAEPVSVLYKVDGIILPENVGFVKDYANTRNTRILELLTVHPHGGEREKEFG